MRLLIAALSRAYGREVRERLYAADARWVIDVAADGLEALSLLARGDYELLLAHACLPGVDGLSLLHELRSWRLCCPPRALLLCEPEQRRGLVADAFAPLLTTPERACRLLETLRTKPVPALALERRAAVARAAACVLDELNMPRGLKGFAYAVWLTTLLALSPALSRGTLGALYADCAAHYGTSAAAVERCLRLAVESVFTRGSLSGIERHFGATVDAERGKPTNRAFLTQAAMRTHAAYSLAATRLPNSNDKHHSPAAPTMV